MWNDIRFAFRSYRKSPGFTAVAALALALGIGANTVMFSAIDAVLLRQLPYRDPDRLVMIWESNPLIGDFLSGRMPAAILNIREWKRQNPFLEDLAYMGTRDAFNLTGQDRPEQVEGGIVSTNFLGLLGVQPVLGRDFQASDAPQGQGQVALISYPLFDRRFGKDRGVIGRTIHIDGAPYSVVGVLPPGFHLPSMWEGFDQKKPDVWIPIGAAGLSQAEIQQRNYFVFGRMKPGVALDQVRSAMAPIVRRITETYPNFEKTWGVSVFPLAVEDTSPVLRRTVVVLQFAVGFVLLIACANVANLLLARTAGREKEIAIRVALGAAKSRRVRQVLAESLLLSVGAAIAGTALAWIGIQAISRLAPEDSYHLRELSLDWKVYAFTLAAALLTALVFGLAPAIHAARQNVNDSLRKGGRAGSSGLSGGLRGILVVSEMALALVLLVGAGLMIRSLIAVVSVPAGFRVDHLLTTHVHLTSPRYRDPKQVTVFCEQVLERVAQIPGVKSVAMAGGFPMLDSIRINSFHVEGEPERENAVPVADVTPVSDGYFETLGAPILRGRSFTRQDAEAETPSVVVVNETLARRIAPKGSAIGKVLRLGDGVKVTVVGIRADTHQMGLDTGARPEMFMPTRSLSSIALMIRTAGEPMNLAGAVRSQIWSIDRDQPVDKMLTGEQRLSEGLEQRRFNMALFGIFAGLALLLASVGIYGVLAYAVSQRTREIGIRIALGATAGNVASLVVRQGLLLAAIGAAIGSIAAFGLTRWMSSLIFGIGATDPLTFSAVPALLIAIALVASYMPARRATKVDPMESLRIE